ncbi:MAG: hypothetical protein KDK90_26850 [Leptospiraceae bacterium]|nr:hypothetical protein [Leptospiraceae bacterium]
MELSNNGILSPYFTDEDFIGGNFERAILLANEIIIAKNNGLINPKMNFFFDAKITDIINKKSYTVLDLWREAGLREIFVGLESGSKNQLKRYGKTATPDKNFQAIEVLKKLGIQIDTGYILFDPEMNFSELLENIEYIKKINLSHMDARSIKKMRAHPFTKLTENYFNNSIIIGKLNLDLLYYPIQFKDEKVISAMNYFENWEKKYSEQVFDLQAMCRGEVGDENLRIKLKKQLSEIRQIDFELLNYYVKYLQCNSLASDLYDIEKNYEFKKKQILDNLTFS